MCSMVSYFFLTFRREAPSINHSCLWNVEVIQLEFAKEVMVIGDSKFKSWTVIDMFEVNFILIRVKYYTFVDLSGM